MHSGRIYVNDANTDSATAYTVLNLRVGVAQPLGRWTFTEFARIDNLTDCNYAGSVIVNDANQRYFEAAPRRNWMIGAMAALKF